LTLLQDQFGGCPDTDRATSGLIALDIVADLEGVGVNVEGPVGSVKDALRAIEEGSFDGVLLDANLRGEPVDEVAAALAGTSRSCS
jgi:hypothetical protein